MSSDDRAMVVLARLDERMDLVVNDVGKLRHVLLEGNGTPALTVTVARLDERLSTLEREKMTPHSRAIYFGAILGGLFSLIDLVLKLTGR